MNNYDEWCSLVGYLTNGNWKINDDINLTQAPKTLFICDSQRFFT